jgi:hypothetical protein
MLLSFFVGHDLSVSFLALVFCLPVFLGRTGLRISLVRVVQEETDTEVS